MLLRVPFAAASSVDDALKGIGAYITSAARTPEHNRRVGGARNSFHLTTNGGTARDIRKTPGMSLNRIKSALSGYDIAELMDEGDHFHVAWRPKRRGMFASRRR